MKKLGAYLLTLLMFCTLLPVPASATEDTVDVWDGTSVDTSWYNYRDFSFDISSAAAFAGFASLITSGENFKDVTVSLNVDIDLNNNAWSPIGGASTANAFQGIFDGRGHNISGLSITKPASPVYVSSGGYDASYAGLFAHNAGTIKNLNIISGNIVGVTYTGSIAAYNLSYGVIENCSSGVSITGGNYENSTGNTEDKRPANTGGIVGCNQGVVRLCKNTGAIADRRGSPVRLGGVVGYNLTADSQVIKCDNLGELSNRSGGIIGVNNGLIDGCINWGGISIERSGGIVYHNNGGIVRNCANYGTIDNGGGILGTNSEPGAIYNCVNFGVASYGIAYYNGSIIQNCYSCGEITVGSIAPINNITGSITYCYIYEAYSTRIDITAGYPTFDATGLIEDGNGQSLLSTLNAWVKQNGAVYASWYENASFPLLALEQGIVVQESLSLAVGDESSVDVTIIPGTVLSGEFIWESSNPSVATVSQEGRVMALRPGITTITVKAAGSLYNDSCEVRVSSRSSQEYRVNSITVRDSSYAISNVIPKGKATVTISITNLSSHGNAMVVLASFKASGQYSGLLWVSMEDVPINATIKVTIPVDNTTGEITQLKAFTVSSFNSFIPLGNAVSFPSG